MRDNQTPGLPPDFPTWPPDPDLAALLCLDFESNYRALERRHLCHRARIIKAKHSEHSRMLYQQLKPQKASTVTHLRSSRSCVLAVVHSEDTFELDLDVPYSSSDLWIISGTSVVVLPHERSGLFRVVGDLFPVLQVGLSVDIVSFHTSFERLEEALASLWNPIWQRHQGLLDSHWNRVVAFGRAFLPEGSPVDKPWTLTRFQRTLDTYKRKATRGPDSWDRLDLIALSDVRKSELADLFGLIQQGSSWPVQLVTGFVLPKCHILICPRISVLSF